jgi:ParB-like chromosome segregation protein Spo0J
MSIEPAFEPEIIAISTAKIIPIKTVTAAYRKTDMYRRIAASLEHVGLIEPLVVFPSGNGTYLLLDGHARLEILIAKGEVTVKCLLSTDNESYTYNKRVSHVPPIAQHHMILRALAHVSEERIASALNVTVATIRDKRDLLKGICPEAAEILRNERVSGAAFCALRKMKAIRQIDVARLVLNAKKGTGRFVRALLDGTRDELLVPTATTRMRNVEPAQQTMMEQETEEMLKHAESIRANYGDDVLDLTAACRYLERVLTNTRIHKYLTKHHPDTLAALEQLLTDTASDKQTAVQQRRHRVSERQRPHHAKQEHATNTFNQ